MAQEMLLSLESALATIDTPLDTSGRGGLITILQDAIRAIVAAAPKKGLAEAAPDVEPLAHLIRVLMVADKVCYPAPGFLRLQLMHIEDLMQEYSGDQARACLRLGCVFARALEVLGEADAETYRVPDTFRVRNRVPG